jgi:hypothetical protein
MIPVLAPILAYFGVQLVKLSPFIIKQMSPILLAAGEDVWKHAYPLAVGIVKDLMDNGKLDGMDKHKEAVRQLEAAMMQDGKFVVKGALKVSQAVLSQIVLSAYANLTFPK